MQNSAYPKVVCSGQELGERTRGIGGVAYFGRACNGGLGVEELPAMGSESMVIQPEGRWPSKSFMDLRWVLEILSGVSLSRK